MDAGLKKVLVGMAAGALGLTMVGCGGDSAEAGAEPAEEMQSTGGEASCGAGSCGAAEEGAEGGEASCGGEGGEEAEGGEASCGAGSCGGAE